MYTMCWKLNVKSWNWMEQVVTAVPIRLRKQCTEEVLIPECHWLCLIGKDCGIRSWMKFYDGEIKLVSKSKMTNFNSNRLPLSTTFWDALIAECLRQWNSISLEEQSDKFQFKSLTFHPLHLEMLWYVNVCDSEIASVSKSKSDKFQFKVLTSIHSIPSISRSYSRKSR